MIDERKLDRLLKQIAASVDEKAAHIAALSAIIASLPETARLDKNAVMALVRQSAPMGTRGKAHDLASLILQHASEIDKTPQQEE